MPLLFAYDIRHVFAWPGPNEPVHVKRVHIAYANSEGSDEPVHMCSLARAFAVRSHNKRELEEASDKEPEIWPHWIAVYAHLKEHKISGH